MGKKGIFVNVPKAYQHKTLDNWMFGYVLGMKRALPSVTTKKAIEMFMYDFNLSEDDYPLDSAMVVYNRCFHSWVASEKKDESY